MSVLQERLVGLGHPGAQDAVHDLMERLAACGGAVAPMAGVWSGEGDLLVGDGSSPVDLDALFEQRGVGVFVEMAETLARLHEAALAHGSLTSRSFSLGPDGRLVVRDVGLAAIVDGTDVTASPRSMHDDVRALCHLAADVIARSTWTDERMRRRIDALLRRGGRRSTTTAVQLAQWLRHLVDMPRREVTPRRQVRSARARIPRRASIALIGLTSAVLVGVAISLLHIPSKRPTAATVSTPTTTPLAPCPTGSLPAVPGAAVMVADVTGTGCAEPVEIVDGTVWAVDSHGTPVHFSLGGPGDQVVLGRWGCDRVALPAVYRPSTGVAYEFDRWAWPGSPSTLRSAREVSTGKRGGTAVAAPAGAPCQHVEVSTP